MAYTAVLSLNRETTHANGNMNPCHNPYQKPTGSMLAAVLNDTLSAQPEINITNNITMMFFMYLLSTFPWIVYVACNTFSKTQATHKTVAAIPALSQKRIRQSESGWFFV
ncbi:hypothetical protein [Parashewanella hymeniacidonis]|uniref:hypothetical protein n=1 Tax=Parashewanella hymeniacidonis TaxID=2807618 RepID=UPI001960F4DB|nr:hypothetical protein [Parashewanella hymeniacidonis]